MAGGQERNNIWPTGASVGHPTRKAAISNKGPSIWRIERACVCVGGLGDVVVSSIELARLIAMYILVKLLVQSPYGVDVAGVCLRPRYLRFYGTYLPFSRAPLLQRARHRVT